MTHRTAEDILNNPQVGDKLQRNLNKVRKDIDYPWDVDYQNNLIVWNGNEWCSSWTNSLGNNEYRMRNYEKDPEWWTIYHTRSQKDNKEKPMNKSLAQKLITLIYDNIDIFTFAELRELQKEDVIGVAGLKSAAVKKLRKELDPNMGLHEAKLMVEALPEFGYVSKILGF